MLILASCDVHNGLQEKTVKFSLDTVNVKLPDVLKEQSGLIYYNSLFWAINDSDTESKIYGFDKTGEIKHSILLLDKQGGIMPNIDWEDITDDEHFIYVGDFGNNSGSRKDLRILKIPKNKINDLEEINIEAEVLEFSWSEQKNFTRRSYKHNFDCEAFFASGDSLYLFTKNWVDKKTSMYVMPKEAGEYSLKRKFIFDVKFCVTGADISSDSKNIILVGYNNYKTYIRHFYAFENNDFFAGENNLFFLKTLGRAQTEGVTYDSNDNIFISTEENWRDNLHQSIYEFKILK